MNVDFVEFLSATKLSLTYIKNYVWFRRYSDRYIDQKPISLINRESFDAENIPALVADLGIRGAWETQRMALFDVRVTDTDAASYVTQPVRSVLAKAETDKKKKYGAACELRRASFTPLVVSVDGALGRESNAFLNRLSATLATKWDRSYSEAST